MSKPISPVGRVSYPSVFQVNDFDGKRNYQVTLLFDKSADLSDMKALATKVAKEKWGDQMPENFRSSFRDGNKKNQPEYEGMTYITFKAQESRRPQVVGPDLSAIVEQDGSFYAGCFAKVSYSCYAYEKKGNVGVAFGLNNVQKVRDGDRLDGGSSADEDFEALEAAADEHLF